jgi:hypothetical protein
MTSCLSYPLKYLPSIRYHERHMFLSTEDQIPGQDLRDFVLRILFISFHEKSVFFRDIRAPIP